MKTGKFGAAGILISLALSGCAIPLPYQFDQKIVDNIDSARKEAKTLCRLATNDNHDALKSRYSALIALVETTMENARSRPRRYGWFERMQFRMSRTAPEAVPSQPVVKQPEAGLSCRTPGEREGFKITGRSPESLQLAQVTLERLDWCHEKQFDPDDRIKGMLRRGIQPVPDPREFRKGELCKTANDYLGDGRLFEMTLKVE